MNHQPQPEKEVQTRLLALWRAKLSLAAKNPWLAAYLLRQSNRIREQLSWLYRQLLALLSLACSRRGWRRVKEALPSLIAGGALLLAMNLNVPPAQAANIPVTTTNDTLDANAGVCLGMTIAQLPGPDGVTSLREAICAANTNPGGDTIDLVTSGITGTINLGSDLPDITESVQLNGPGAANLTIDGGGVNNALYGPSPGTDIGVDGLTIANVTGDGVYAYNNATVTNSIVTGNTGDGVAAYNGNATVTDSIVTGEIDGVYTYNGDATVTDSTVTGNTGDGVAAYNNATITDSTVTGDNYGVYAYNGDATVNNSTVTGNDGDGVFAYNNATVTNNSAVTGYYAGVFTFNGDATVTDSTITGNNYHGVAAGNNAIVTNSTVTGDALNPLAEPSFSCGVYAYNGDATVTNSTVTGYDDGVFVLNGNATVSGSTVTGRYWDGVGTYNGDATVTNSTVTGYYDGVYAYNGNATVSGSTVTGNNNYNGVYAYNGDATVTNSTVTGDDDGVDANQGDVTVDTSTITGNDDGINANRGNVTVTNSTITGVAQEGIVAYNNITVANSTISSSGRYGIQSYNAGTVRVTNSTITGSGNFGINNAGPNYLNNSIVAGNNGGGPDLNGPFNNTTSQFNLVGNGDGSGLTNGNGNQVGTTGSLIDPLLGPLVNNGGPTFTHALLPGSPAIDTANNGICISAPINGVDQRSRSRTTPAGGLTPDGDGDGTITCDIGAYEYQGPVPPPMGGEEDEEEKKEESPPPAPIPAPQTQQFDCWPWEIIIPPLVVPGGGVICQPSLGEPLPVAGTFRYLGHSTEVEVKDAAGVPVTQFNPPLKVCFRYTPPELAAVEDDPANFLLQTLRDGIWETLTTTPESDPSPSVLGRVCAPVDHLTLFALFDKDGNGGETTRPPEHPPAAVKYLPETGVRPVAPWLQINSGLVVIGGMVFAVVMVGGVWLVWRKRNGF